MSKKKDHRRELAFKEWLKRREARAVTSRQYDAAVYALHRLANRHFIVTHPAAYKGEVARRIRYARAVLAQIEEFDINSMIAENAWQARHRDILKNSS